MAPNSSLRNPLKVAIAFTLLLIPSATSASQDKASPPPLFDQFEPNSGQHFGTIHPEAPPETAQFDFLVGEFTCNDELRQADGSWRQSHARWRASYLVNGHGIIDQYWNEGYAGMSVRNFNPTLGKWEVYFLGASPLFTGSWLGTRQDDSGNMVMLQDRTLANGQSAISRLTFFNISEDSFDWVGELVVDGTATPTWRISCQRER